MRVLWVTPIPLGPANRILNAGGGSSSGGWVQSEYEALMQEDHSGVELFFLCGSRKVQTRDILKKQTEEGIAYAVNIPAIPFGRKLPAAILNNIKKILDEVQPDIIHIWGTENYLSYGVAKMSEGIRKVVFLQGIIGIHQRYKGGYLLNTKEYRAYCGHISLTERIKTTLKKDYFQKQVPYEQYVLRNSQGVIIDNEFSEAYCKMVSSKLPCYYRFLYPNTIFASQPWSYDTCTKNSIFTVYGSSADKGMHQLLKALVIVKKEIPDVKLTIPGPFACENGKLKPISQLSPYEKWMANYINKNGLSDNVYFPGKLTPSQMAENLRNSHMFVNPSCMETHALSLREAMTVGLPSVTSLCGSVIEYVNHNENGLIYRYEEYEMLAYQIKKVLLNREFSEKLSRNAQRTMTERHELHNYRIMDIYLDILKNPI